MVDLNHNDYNLQKISKVSTLIEKTYSQYTPNNNTNPVTNSTTLPVLLIHGHMENATVWNKWVDLLKKDGISAVYPITFKQSDDECGSAAEHAKELSNIIRQIKKETGQNKVNIVAHSKGGLDARVYLANNTIKDVAKLVLLVYMI
jgi:triacylglycerol esterase/lipase EstA (alpha/beta hydrolase family)